MSDKLPCIKTIIEERSDGSYIYMSHKGKLNLDNHAELRQEQLEDDLFLKQVSGRCSAF